MLELRLKQESIYSYRGVTEKQLNIEDDLD